MSSPETIATLNRLVMLHGKSLPVYLSYARPYELRGDEKAVATLNAIAKAHQAMVDRLAKLIEEEDGAVINGDFPIYFTGLHDLSYEYLTKEMVALQKRDIHSIEEAANDLRLAPMARALADEALGEAKAHLDALEEIVADKTPAGDA